MIDIIALIFLCRLNGNLAIQKGLNASTWKWYTVIAWFSAEIIGVILAMGLFGQANLVAILSVALVSAFGGYLFIRSLLDKKPDQLEDEINSIGVDDLHPRK